MLSYNPPYTQYIFQKLDFQGAVVSSKTFGDDSSDYYVIYSFIKTDDNKLCTIGSYYRDINSQKVYGYLAKLDINGDTMWTKKYPAPQGFR